MYLLISNNSSEHESSWFSHCHHSDFSKFQKSHSFYMRGMDATSPDHHSHLHQIHHHYNNISENPPLRALNSLPAVIYNGHMVVDEVSGVP